MINNDTDEAVTAKGAAGIGVGSDGELVKIGNWNTSRQLGMTERRRRKEFNIG
jgi:hypothetical protein